MDAVIHSASLTLVATDMRGCITDWNAAAAQLFGWTADEVLGRPIDLIVPGDRQSELTAAMAAVKRGDPAPAMNTVWSARDGSDVAVLLQVSPIVDAGGDVVGASMFAFENALQQETRRALLASESRYRALVESLAEFVVVTNAYGRTIGRQPSWCAYTGQTSVESAALGWRDALHADDRAMLDATWDACAVRRVSFRFDARVFHAESGEYRHCEFRVAPVRNMHGRVVEWVAAVADVHERHLAQERERLAAERFQRVFDANVFGMCYGEKRRILDGNDAMLEMLGATRRDMMTGIEVDDLMFKAGSGGGGAAEYEIRRLDGTTGYLMAAAVPLGDGTGWLAVAVDVTQRKATEREVEHRAMHDPLTGLPNRRLLVDRLEHALARSGRGDSLIGVLFCDLDHFKEINDQYGHAVGDGSLEILAERLQELLRDGDTVARTGGDEFVIVLEDIEEPEDACSIAERVRVAVSEPIVVDDLRLRVTCSVGVTLNNGVDDRVESLLSRADDAMYLAKQQGRDQTTLAVGAAAPQAQRRWVERELERALAEDTLDLAFQPVVDLRSGRPVGAEALLRCEVNGELVPTVRVISVAEETGMIVRVSDWVLRVACSQFAKWRAENDGASEWKLHVNISARDLADEYLVDRVLGAIGAAGLAASDVCLEVTETAMVQHPERAHERLAALRAHGVVVAIDDFGMGYASLGVLRDVPADIVKIDREFVVGLGHSERDRAIVEHAIELAHRLGLVVVGEGVETLAQLSILDELGCDQAQGYAFAHPKPVGELELSL